MLWLLAAPRTGAWARFETIFERKLVKYRNTQVSFRHIPNPAISSQSQASNSDDKSPGLFFARFFRE